MDLCRLCTKQQDPLKDLLDDFNSNIRKVTEKFTHVIVTPNDDLPTKICLDCEEKLVTFELFLLECQRAQEYFLKTLSLQVEVPVKLEIEDHDYSIPDPTNEEKSESAVDDVTHSFNTDVQKFDNTSEVGDDNDFRNGSDYDDMDDVAIATLKKIIHEEEPETKDPKQCIPKLEELIVQPYLRTRDLVTFECKTCKDIFKSWIKLQRHTFEAHNKNPTVNCVCGYIITSYSQLYNHTGRHKAEHKKMRVINYGDDGSNELNDKSKKLSEYIDFKCKYCDVEFKGWYKLKNHHERVHKGQLFIVSCTCGAALKSKSGMYNHVKDHLNPNHSCHICHKSYKSPIALEKHTLRHVDKSMRRFECTHCDKVFKVRDFLISHLKSHIPIEKRREFFCDICNFGFTTKSAAMQHRKIVHEKVKGYVCDQCGYACGTGGELRQHKAIHSDEKPFRCTKCDKTFKTYSNLKTHLDTHEGTSYVCYICNRVLNSKRTLRKHLLVHEDHCKHVCPYCGKAFKRRQTLVVHQHTHTGDKPITCKICGEKFTYSSTLRTHRIRCHPETCQKDGASGQNQSMGIVQPGELTGVVA